MWTVHAGLLAPRVRMWAFCPHQPWAQHPVATTGLPRFPQWPVAVSSLTVARQRGICTRFP